MTRAGRYIDSASAREKGSATPGGICPAGPAIPSAMPPAGAAPPPRRAARRASMSTAIAALPSTEPICRVVL